MLSVLFIASLTATATPIVPSLLTDPEAGGRLRWRTLRLQEDGASAAGRAFRFEAAPPVVLRFDDLPPACELRVKRRFVAGGAFADVPVPVARDGARRMVVVPPPMGRADAVSLPGGDAAEPAASFVVELAGTCADAPLRAYRAVMEEDDKEGPLRVTSALEALAQRATTDDEAVAWSRAEHSHRWQATLAELAILRRLLAREPDRDAAVVGRVEALVERARREAPWPDIQYLWHEAFEPPGERREVATESSPFADLAAGKSTDLDVGRAEALRLRVRLPLAVGEAGPVATRLGIAFDARAPTVIPVLGGQDVEARGTTRARTFVVPVPPGARHVRLWSFDRPLLLKGERLWRKRHLQDTARRGGAAPALAITPAPARGALGAWLALDRARDVGPAAVAVALRELDARPAGAGDELEREAARLVRRIADEARAELRLAAGDATSAVRTLVRGAAARVLTDDEAAWLADAQALIDDDVSLGGHALAVLGGVLARRPLDRSLVAAHARAFVLGAQWRRLSPAAPLPEVAFLDPATGAAGAAARTRFAPIPPGGLDIELPATATGERPVVLTLVTRPAPKAEVRTVTLDGRAVARLPVTTTLEEHDIAVPPGHHHLAVSPSDASGGAGTWVDFAAAPVGGAVLRHYTELGQAPLTFALTELGVPATVQVSLRAVVSSTTGNVAPFELAIESGGGQRRLIAVTLGAPDAGADGPAPRWRATSPLELVVPLPPGARSVSVGAKAPPGARLFAHVAARVRRSFGPAAPPDAGPPPARASSTLEKAQAFIAADEPLPAREALLAVLDDPASSPGDRGLAAGLWRELDEGPPALADGGRRPLSPGLCLVPQEEGPLPDDTLGLVERLGAARAAEITGALATAAEHWSRLAAARPACPPLARQAALALLAADPGAAAAARAHALLVAAAAEDASDPLTARAVRRARRRTRLRFLPFAERSAGSFLVATSRGEATDATDPEPIAWPRDDHRAGVVGKDRDLTLSFSVTHASRATLRISPIELRPRTAEATGAPAPSLTWSRDGAPAETLACAPDRECSTSAFDLTPGAHLIVARLSGGVRPAARLWLDDWGAPPTGLRRAAYAPTRREPPPGLATTFAAEHLAATPSAPIQLTVQGPVVLRVELRRRPDGARGGAVVAARPLGMAPPNGDGRVARAVDVPGLRDAEAIGADGGALSVPTVVEVPLVLAAAYSVEIAAGTRLLLARVGVWEGVATAPPPPVPLAYVSRDPAPAVAPLSLDATPTVAVVDGDVPPGRDDVGSLAVWTTASRLSTDPEGAPVQTVSALHFGATYRQLVEPLHTAARVEAGQRFNDAGAPSQALSTSLFFIHPEHRAVRFGLDADARTQPVEGQRAWSGRVSMLVEPVVTIAPGLHLVSKLSSWWSRRTLSSVANTTLPFVDPEVFSRYGQTHPRALAWEEGLEAEPFLNLVVYANARATTNPSLRPNDLDHVSTSLFARALFGRTYVEALGRTTWFLVDGDRAHLARHSWLGTRFFQTVWPSERQMVELGVVAGYDFGTHAPEVRLSLVWEGSNGRRFGDHSPREGEDFFFAERGPGLATSRLTVRP